MSWKLLVRTPMILIVLGMLGYGQTAGSSPAAAGKCCPSGCTDDGGFCSCCPLVFDTTGQGFHMTDIAHGV